MKRQQTEADGQKPGVTIYVGISRNEHKAYQIDQINMEDRFPSAAAMLATAIRLGMEQIKKEQKK